MVSQRSNEKQIGLLSTNSNRVKSSLNNKYNRLGIGEYAVGKSPLTLATYGLGSCVALIIYDPVHSIGGLVHIMLPSSSRDTQENPWKYANKAVKNLYNEVKKHTNTPTPSLQAKIVGGSKMFEFVEFGENIGQRNIERTRQELEKIGIEIIGEDTGGKHGRRVIFDTTNGDVKINTSSSNDTIVL